MFELSPVEWLPEAPATPAGQPNAELAYRVLDHIDAHPEQWDQGAWWTQTKCGTAGCFAGWTAALSDVQLGGWNVHPKVVVGPGDLLGLQVDHAACKLLGIPDDIWRDADGTPRSLFDPVNDRAALGGGVLALFGPRPGTENSGA